MIYSRYLDVKCEGALKNCAGLWLSMLHIVADYFMCYIFDAVVSTQRTDKP